MTENENLALNYALRFVGQPYLWGGDDPIRGFDCSGFVIEVLKAFGLVANFADLTSQGLFHLFEHDSLEEVSPPCLLFFGESNQKITHVALAITEKHMAEAGGGDSTIKDLETAARKNAFVRIRPIANRRDLVAVCKPIWG